jgi:hypothetical protein
VWHCAGAHRKQSCASTIQVNDLMSRRGWHLNALQFPPAVHMCFTAQHLNVVEDLLKVGVFCCPLDHTGGPDCHTRTSEPWLSRSFSGHGREG